MNVFMNDNFLNTHGRMVDVLQVIRQIAEDDDVIESEVHDILCEYHNYLGDDFQEELREGTIDFAVQVDDVLYVDSNSLRAVFEELFPDDHTRVVDNLATNLATFTGTVLRVDHNGSILEAAEEEPAPWNFDTAATAPTPPISMGQAVTQRADAPIPENSVVTAVDTNAGTLTTRTLEPTTLDAAFALSSSQILGTLKFNGHTITTAEPTGKNGVVFQVEQLYGAVYGNQINQEFLQNLIVTKRFQIDREDIFVQNGMVYLSKYAIAKLHPDFCYQIEWAPAVSHVVNAYLANPYEDLHLDILGNRIV